MQEHILRIRWLGRQFDFRCHGAILPMTLVLRLAMAWIFLWAGIDKLLGGFSAEGFLLNATRGPLIDLWSSLGESGAALSVIDPLVTWSQILMGLALALGLVVRLTFFFGGVQMFLFYIAQFPPEHNPFMEYYLVYILLFLALGALGAGRVLGVDRYIEATTLVRRRPWLKYLLG